MGYKKNIDFQNVPVKKFDLHPDALSSRRPDASIYSLDQLELNKKRGLDNVFNMTLPRQFPIYVSNELPKEAQNFVSTDPRIEEKSLQKIGPKVQGTSDDNEEIIEAKDFILVEPISGATLYGKF